MCNCDHFADLEPNHLSVDLTVGVFYSFLRANQMVDIQYTRTRVCIGVHKRGTVHSNNIPFVRYANVLQLKPIKFHLKWRAFFSLSKLTQNIYTHRVVKLKKSTFCDNVFIACKSDNAREWAKGFCIFFSHILNWRKINYAQLLMWKLLYPPPLWFTLTFWNNRSCIQ